MQKTTEQDNSEASTPLPPLPDQLTRLTLIAFVLAGVLIVLVVIALAIPGSPIHIGGDGQVAVLRDFLLILLVFCPLIICLFPIYMLLMLAVFAMEKGHRAATKGLGHARRMSRDVSEKATATADEINRRSIELNAKLTFAERLVNFLDWRPRRNRYDEDNV